MSLKEAQAPAASSSSALLRFSRAKTNVEFRFAIVSHWPKSARRAPPTAASMDPIAPASIGLANSSRRRARSAAPAPYARRSALGGRGARLSERTGRRPPIVPRLKHETGNPNRLTPRPKDTAPISSPPKPAKRSCLPFQRPHPPHGCMRSQRVPVRHPKPHAPPLQITRSGVACVHSVPTMPTFIQP